jgi:hypothetical protein
MVLISTPSGAPLFATAIRKRVHFGEEPPKETPRGSAKGASQGVPKDSSEDAPNDSPFALSPEVTATRRELEAFLEWRKTNRRGPPKGDGTEDEGSSTSSSSSSSSSTSSSSSSSSSDSDDVGGLDQDDEELLDEGKQPQCADEDAGLDHEARKRKRRKPKRKLREESKRLKDAALEGDADDEEGAPQGPRG